MRKLLYLVPDRWCKSLLGHYSEGFRYIQRGQVRIHAQVDLRRLVPREKLNFDLYQFDKLLRVLCLLDIELTFDLDWVQLMQLERLAIFH